MKIDITSKHFREATFFISNTRCPLALACLTTALHNKEEYGIWGGATPNERKKLKTRTQAKKFLFDLQDKADDLGSLKPKRKR